MKCKRKKLRQLLLYKFYWERVSSKTANRRDFIRNSQQLCNTKKNVGLEIDNTGTGATGSYDLHGS